jgi:hypothetical protein
VNDPANWPLQPGGAIDLRLATNGAINIDGGTKYRMFVTYELTDVNQTPEDPTDDTGTLTLQLANAATPTTILMTSKWAVTLQQVIGDAHAIMGWSAATGGLNARQEITRFTYDGPEAAAAANITEMYVTSSAWSAAFKQYLETKGLGDHNYGYKLLSGGAPVAGPADNTDQILPWINMDQIVVRFNNVPTSGIPTVGSTVFTSQQGQAYTATAVAPVAGDPTAYLITLNKPLGGGNPTLGTAPTPQENGDRITMKVTGAGAAGTDFSLRMNVLQGDLDHTGEAGTHSTLAADTSALKKKFFSSTTNVGSGDAAYSVFADVDGSGVILADDFSAVKKRFFEQMPPPPPAAAGALFSTSRVAEEVLA